MPRRVLKGREEQEKRFSVRIFVFLKSEKGRTAVIPPMSIIRHEIFISRKSDKMWNEVGGAHGTSSDSDKANLNISVMKVCREHL